MNTVFALAVATVLIIIVSSIAIHLGNSTMRIIAGIVLALACIGVVVALIVYFKKYKQNRTRNVAFSYRDAYRDVDYDAADIEYNWFDNDDIEYNASDELP